jgi:DNA-binding NtrC family response regulator
MKPSGISILVVSSGEIIPAEIVRSLKKKRYGVTVSGGEDEALAALKRRTYDIAVLETGTSSVDNLLREIRLYSPKCACILVSGSNDLDDAVEAMRWGAFDYIGEPFSEERLLRSIRTAVQRKILQKQVAHLRSEIKQQFSFDNIVGKTPVDAGGLHAHREGCPHKREHTHLRQQRHGQRDGRPRDTLQ